MRARKAFRWSGAGAVLVSSALLWQGNVWGQGVSNDEPEYRADSYFDTPNWVEDDHGWYDQDFDWETDDPGYARWNDTDLNAWSGDEPERGHWGVFGYDDADEAGLFDW